jgi:hypothetical protein
MLSPSPLGYEAARSRHPELGPAAIRLPHRPRRVRLVRPAQR